MKIFRMTFRSRNFDFEAFGKTEIEARKALNLGLAEHGRGYRLPSNWESQGGAGHYSDIEEFEIGVCYRDSEPLKKA